MHSLVCSLVPLLWLGMVPPVVPGPALYYASARWPATPAHTYHSFLPPSCTLHCPSALAFSSEDKGSWRLACRDLIAEAHFTLPKPGLIHLSTPAPLLTETCFCLRRSPACVFFSSSSWIERKSGIRSELRERGKNAFLAFAYSYSLFNFSSHGADRVFHLVSCKRHSHAFSFVFVLYCFWPSAHSAYSSASTFYSNTTRKSRLKHKENTDVRTIVI